MEELPVFTTRLSVERRFFGFWGKTFFFGPVTWLQLVVFVGSFLFLLLPEIALNFPGGVFWAIIVLVGGPMGVASFASSGLEQTDRKRPHLYLLSQFRYLLVENRTLVRFQGQHEPRRFRVRFRVWQPRPAPVRMSWPVSKNELPAAEITFRPVPTLQPAAPARPPEDHPLAAFSNFRWTRAEKRAAVGGIVRLYLLLFGFMGGSGVLIGLYVLLTGRAI